MENDGVKASVCRDSRDGEGTGDRVCKGVVTIRGKDCQPHRGGQGRQNPTDSLFLGTVSFHR